MYNGVKHTDILTVIAGKKGSDVIEYWQVAYAIADWKSTGMCL